MPRLRNIATDAVISCSDETAARLGSEWEPVKASETKAPAKKAASSKSEK